MRLPDLVAYQTAIQHPATAFTDPSLRAATVATGNLGLPRAVAGNFAVTYQLRSGASVWAVRCFHREAADRASRYAAISQSLARTRGGPLVPIEYLDHGVRVSQGWYPITKMAWIDGHPLNAAVESSLSRPNALRALERRFVEVVADLRHRGIAHGDLQHGNILVDASGALRLVDYDGMFVPTLRGRPASETGDPNYQHPRRGVEFDLELDRFAAIVIVVALRALAAEPGLWSTYNTGDNLLFRRTDFVDPSASKLFVDLSHINGVRELSDRLGEVCASAYARVPLLDDFLRQPPLSVAAAPARTPAPLKADHVVVLNGLYGGHPRPKAPVKVQTAKRSWTLRRASVQHALAFSTDGAWLASGDRNGRISLRDVGSGRTLRTLRLPRSAGVLRELAFAAGGELLAVVSEGPSLSLWDALAQRRLHDLTADGRAARSLALSEDAAWLVAGSDDGTLRCWRTARGRLTAAWTHSGAVSALAVARDGRVVASAGPRTHVDVWRMADGRCIGSLATGRGATCLAFTSDGSRLAVGTAEGRLGLWDVRSGRRVDELAAFASPLERLALSPDAACLGASGTDGSVWVRRLQPRPTLAHPRPANTAADRVIASSYRLFDWLRSRNWELGVRG